ncbi:sterol 3-beta-glucosyltransferase isoform X2 [Rhodamnia argentea]|uniref:Sterol 3-beta-glucosyltransferase isoform X2 n=1 Tax=Rhodamnia argentea TaxID=178133 RepID=A0ABM3HG55_9MYRT|nr:sterol 3-beta-glucosyltransferase isoform X2 [Rhodamnia argentea]
MSNPSESEKKNKKRANPIALFMAFGTKGDVFPIAAIAAAFGGERKDYRVFFVTHLAHRSLSAHLTKKCVTYVPISSPPVLPIQEDSSPAGSLQPPFSLQKRNITNVHRQECLSAVESIFGLEEVIAGDFILINFFALEGWNLAELFQVRCVVAAPYVVPYSAPSSFERHFRKKFPLLYEYLQEAPSGKVCWKDVTHWMWPLFEESWGYWRSDVLHLSSIPFTDPVTSLPMWHERDPSPPLLYGFSEDIVEHPDYWPSNVRVCGFWFIPIEWQFSCQQCLEGAAPDLEVHSKTEYPTCSVHVQLHSFLKTDNSMPLVFVGLSSIGSMGLMRNPQAFLAVLQIVTRITNYRFILFTAGHEPLQAAVLAAAAEESSSFSQRQFIEDGIILFSGQLFCFSGSIPYLWLFPKCAVAVHHGGSGSTAAALKAGIPQVICPFLLDQFYWAERMFWLGVAPEPLKRCHLLPESTDGMCIMEAANVFTGSIHTALSATVQARAADISSQIAHQDGVSEAVKILEREIVSVQLRITGRQRRIEQEIDFMALQLTTRVNPTRLPFWPTTTRLMTQKGQRNPLELHMTLLPQRGEESVLWLSSTPKKIAMRKDETKKVLEKRRQRNQNGD